MALLLVKHTVENFDEWYEAFKKTDHISQTYGCVKASIWRESNYPNCVLVMFEFETEKQARAYMEDDEVVAAWQESNLSRPTRVEYFEKFDY